MNDINFWLSQLIGIEALLLLLISYRKKNTNEILVVQVISSLCYVVHYLLLGAFSGVLICLLDFFRDILYYKTDKDNLLFLLSAPFYILVGVLNFNTFIDMLPTVASLNDGYILTRHKKVVLVGSIVSCVLWIVYDLKYKSYSGAIASLIVIVSNLSILLFDKKITNVTSQQHLTKKKK